MNKMDILKNNFYIKKFINVIKGRLLFTHKSTYTNGRRSDAFIYIISGSCTYKFDDGIEFTANENNILYLAHKAVYKMYIHTTNYKFIYCDFEFDSDLPRKSAVYSPENFSDTENLFFKLLKCYSAPSSSSFTECMALLYEIYSVIMQTNNKEYIAQSSRNKIEHAKAYIDLYFKNLSLSVQGIAETIGMSEVYFRKLFKSQYGISPSQYIISMRLKKSKELMKYSFLTLKECAIQSGFSSAQYFCRTFKKNVGMTPSKYRNKK